MKNESAVKKAITAEIKRRGGWYTMPHQRGFSQPGVPDIIAIFLSTPIVIEAKFNGNQPSPAQERELAKAEKAGAIALVIDEVNIGLFYRWLDALEDYSIQEMLGFPPEVVH